MAKAGNKSIVVASKQRRTLYRRNAGSRNHLEEPGMGKGHNLGEIEDSNQSVRSSIARIRVY